MEHESGSDTNCNWSARYSHQRIDKGTGGLGKKIVSGDYPNDSIILFTNPSAQAGYDTRPVFKRSLTGFNSEFSFS